MMASKVYGSAYTFASINKNDTPTYLDVESVLSRLVKLIEFFNTSKKNSILFSTDYADVECGDQNLEFHLFDITEDPQATTYYLSEIEKIIGARKAYIDTGAMIACILENSLQNLPLEYALRIEKYWLGLDHNIHIVDYSDVCNLNSINFRNGVTTRKNFTEKANCVYEHIQFHSIFEEKLKTVKRGTFTDYLSEFSHALNTLNQAYFLISNDENKNEEDLLCISELSALEALQGRKLSCTRQGANKPRFEFDDLNNPEQILNQHGVQEVVYPKEELNCEYHLKINFNDQGIKLHDDYIRAYFALKYCDKMKRKYIKLAYIGEHWPPNEKGKKRRA
ncbi:MAG: hypothetical protein ACJAS1_005655 [Oleiphilaceae bacterium]|jgi:hypothetical protein